jgi:predicted ArsR family transcriptional regulator
VANGRARPCHAPRSLTEALEGQAPSATQLGERLGISRLSARKLLLRLAARGLVADVPKLVSSGQWAVTPDGDRALALKE